jgi:hypothetical protein
MGPVAMESATTSTMETATPESLALSRSRICAGHSEREQDE